MKTDLLHKMDFGNEAGDDVGREELTSYFVEQEMFQQFLNPSKRILVATARKGVGKSALLQWLYHKLAGTSDGDIVIKCRGADLVRSRFGISTLPSSPNDHVRDWMIRICSLVNRELARLLGLAITDDQITLVETAELDGWRSRNLLGCLIDRFRRILGDGSPEKLRAKDEHELLKRVAKDRRIWILIDDLDATFQMTKEESVELSTFFSACRYLTQDLGDINFRLTMRTDVWAVIRRFDEALDKLEQYVNEILWSLADFRSLLYMRVKSQMTFLEIKIPAAPEYTTVEEQEEYLLRNVFVPRMPWGEKEQQTYRVLYTMSYYRPRWAIQLCKLAQESALRRKATLIAKRDIDEVWGDYGAKRIADLVAEHKHQCREVDELLNSFRGCDRLLMRDQLFDWINKRILNHVTPVIENNRCTSARDVAQFLYRLGFIVARSDEREGSYEHYFFHQMPDFLTSRTNEDFNVSWEVHPCYREALDIKKINKSHRRKFGQLRGMHFDDV